MSNLQAQTETFKPDKKMLVMGNKITKFVEVIRLIDFVEDIFSESTIAEYYVSTEKFDDFSDLILEKVMPNFNNPSYLAWYYKENYLNLFANRVNTPDDWYKWTIDYKIVFIIDFIIETVGTQLEKLRNYYEYLDTNKDYFQDQISIIKTKYSRLDIPRDFELFFS
jgi:hypothetical protein